MQRLKNGVDGDQSNLMGYMLQMMNLSDEYKAGLKTAYTAVSSRMVAGNEQRLDAGLEIGYRMSLNVMHPILNILRWNDLIPHDDNERELREMTGDAGMSDVTEPPKPPAAPKKRGFFARLFGRE